MNDRIDDAGITLVELLVYIVVAGIVLGSLAVLFANGLRAQTQATDRDRATGAGSVVNSSLMASIRNASDFVVVDGRRLVAKVANGRTDWECRAWSVEAGELRYRAGQTGLATADTAGWGVIARGVGGTLAGGAAFAEPADRALTVGLEMVSGGSSLHFDNAVTAQAVDDGTDPTTCW